jgi:putative ABC transport system ATP-binding protein
VRISSSDVKELLIEINEKGQTILPVTHDMAFAESSATRTVELVDGQVFRAERMTVR